MVEMFLKVVVGPFLKGYIFLFGDDPEMIAYAGLAFVIFYASVFLCAMAIGETVLEHHLISNVSYWLRCRRFRKRILKLAKKKKKRLQLEKRMRMRIDSEALGEEVNQTKDMEVPFYEMERFSTENQREPAVLSGTITHRKSRAGGQ